MSGRGRRLAYADPPYPGNARLYRGHRDYAGEVDHAALITRLNGYDGWGLSTSASALPVVLALCPAGVRVAAWHRGERPRRWSRYPLNAWEPVIYRPAPARRVLDGPRRTDSLVHGIAPMTTLPGRVIGAKPAAFCRWLFELLDACPGDQLDDLFPGSGAVARAWTAYTGAVVSVGDAEPSHEALGDASRQVLHDASPEPSRPARGDASRPTAGATAPRHGGAA